MPDSWPRRATLLLCLIILILGRARADPGQLEEPDIKASDISSAVTFLQPLSYVDGDRIGGLGICGSGSYMPYAAVQDDRIKAVTSVVPATTMNSMIMMPTDQAEADREAYEAGEAEPTYIDLMPRAYAEGAAYYYNEDRGWRDNWDNHAVSWSELSWVDFQPAEFIRDLQAPYLIITVRTPGAVPVRKNCMRIQLPKKKSISSKAQAILICTIWNLM